MSNPIIFCNIGWMREYRGQTATDKIVGGGKYVRVQQRGEEVCNFVSHRGRVYGYVQPVGSTIALERLGAKPDAEELQGVDVVVTARRPHGGTVIVGWFRNATVFRKPQPLKALSSKHKANNVRKYRYAAQAADVVLLAPDQRTTPVPRGEGGMGQSNVWYAESISRSYKTKVRDLLSGSHKPRSPRHPPRSSDPAHRAAVEIEAMKLAKRHYNDLEYSVEDVSNQNLGWDLQAKKGSVVLNIEVKGLSGHSRTIELTPNEYTAFSAQDLNYRLCIVTSCLSKPVLTVCFFNPAAGRWGAEGRSMKGTIRVTEKKAAIITVT